MSDVEALMKRCSAGTMSYEAANGLHADCYGMLGRQAEEIKGLQAEVAGLRYAIIQARDALGVGGEDE